MQWVIRFLQKRLKQEEDIAAFHGTISGYGRKFAESARLARERVPQLKGAIELISKCTVSEPRKKRNLTQIIGQLELFK